MGSSAAVNGYYLAEVATFNTAAPAAGATWLRLGHLGTEELGKEQLFDDAQEANANGARTARNPTVKSGSFALKLRVRTGSKALDGPGGDGGPLSCYAQKLLESYFGAEATTILGTTVAASSGPGLTTPLTVTSNADMALGMALQIGSEFRVITGISGGNITLNRDLDTAGNYANSTIIYGGFFFKPTLGSYAKYLYLTHVTGAKVDMIQKVRVTGFKIAGLGAKEGLRYEFALAADSYTRSGVTPTSIPAELFTGAPIVSRMGTVHVGTTARTVRTGGVEFNAVHEEQEASATSGAENGRQAWDIVRVDGGSISIEQQYSAQDWTDWEAATKSGVQITHSVGSTNAAKARGSITVWMASGEPTTQAAVVNMTRGQTVTFAPIISGTSGMPEMAFTVHGGE